MPSSNLSEPWRYCFPSYQGSHDIEAAKMYEVTFPMDVSEYRKAEDNAFVPNETTLASHSTSFLESWRARKRRKWRRDDTDDSNRSSASTRSSKSTMSSASTRSSKSTMSSASTRSYRSTMSSASSRDFDPPTTPSSTIDFACSVDSNPASTELDQASSTSFDFNDLLTDMRLQRTEFKASIPIETSLASYLTLYSEISTMSSTSSWDFDQPTTPSSTVDFACSVDSNLTSMESSQTSSDFFDFNDLPIDMSLQKTELNTLLKNETPLASHSTSLAANCQRKCCKLGRDHSDNSAMSSATFHDFDLPTTSSSTIDSACLMNLNTASMEMDQTSPRFSGFRGFNYLPIGTSIESSDRDSMLSTHTCSASNFFDEMRPGTPPRPMTGDRDLFSSPPMHPMDYPISAKQIEATSEAQDYNYHPETLLQGGVTYHHDLAFVADLALPAAAFPSCIPSLTHFNYTPLGTASAIHVPWSYIPQDRNFRWLQDPQDYELHHYSQQEQPRYLSLPPALSGITEYQMIQNAFKKPSMAENYQNRNIHMNGSMLQSTESDGTESPQTDASQIQLTACKEESESLGLDSTFWDDNSWGGRGEYCPNRSPYDIIEPTRQSLKGQRYQRPARVRSLWCHVGNCRSSPLQFNTSVERYLHYENFHPHLVLKCADSSCSYATTGFLRNSDRMRHYKSKHTRLYDKLQSTLKTSSRPITVLGDAKVESDSLRETSTVKDASSQNGIRESRTPTATITDNFPDTSAEDPEKLLDSPESTNTPNTDPSMGSTMSPSSPMTETDWESDSISGDGAYYILSDPCHGARHDGGDQTYSNKITLSHSKQTSVNRIMDEFYVIFNQEWTASLKKATGPSASASSPLESRPSGSSVTKDSSSGQSRKRRLGGDESSPHDDENNPKKPKPSSPPSETPLSGFQFACPYYKHDPEKYGLNHESSNPAYRSCALKKFVSIARMKAHLYKSHKVPVQCKRCWQPFQDQVQLDAHMTVDSAKICDVREPQPLEGITPEVEQRVRSRKKSYPGQSEGGIWRDIFRILFPNETVPSPFHDPIQYNTASSPDSQAVADYEEFRAQQLPALFQSRVEAMITQPGRSEDSIMRHLTDIILDCSGELYSLYRSGFQSVSDAPLLMSMPETDEGNPSPAPGVNELGHLKAAPTQGCIGSGTPSISRSPRLRQPAREANSTSQGAQMIAEMPPNEDDGLEAAQTQVDVPSSESISIQEPLLRPTSRHKSPIPAERAYITQGVYENDRLALFHQQLPPQDSANLGPGLREVQQRTGRLPKSPTQHDFSDSGYGSYPADIPEAGVPQSQGSRQDNNSIDFSFEKVIDDDLFTESDQLFPLDDYLNFDFGQINNAS